MNSKYENFLLKHYAQVNEHLRESDRKRDILLGTYFTLSVAGVSFCFNIQDTPDTLYYRVGILTFLIFFGFIVAIIVKRFRGWHAEYVNVAMAIHKCFIDGHYDLFKAAKDVKSEKKCPYFFKGGVEFMMMVLVLLFLSSEAISLAYWVCDLQKLYLNLLIYLGIFLVIMIGGCWRYKVYLVKREEKFPENSVYILGREKKGAELPGKG